MRFELRKFDDPEIKEALSFLKEGETIVIGDITIAQLEEDLLNVIGWSSYNDLKNLTKKIVLKELDEIKLTYARFLNEFQLFNLFQKEKRIRFELGFDTGKGGVGICSQLGDKIKWHIDL